MPSRLHILVSGRVQGVGYRHFVYRHASSAGIAGWVRNLPDGRVEAVFEGDQPALENVLDRCRSGPALSRVEKVETEWEEPTGACEGFDIRF